MGHDHGIWFFSLTKMMAQGLLALTVFYVWRSQYLRGTLYYHQGQALYPFLFCDNKFPVRRTDASPRYGQPTWNQRD